MKYDIVVVGGGIVGSLFALALSQETSLSIAILESQARTSCVFPQYHHRVSAIGLSSQRIFQALGIWQAIKNKRVSPFTQIQVWDAFERGYIHFDCKDIMEVALGYIIENNIIQSVIEEKLKSCTNVSFFHSVKLVNFSENENGVELMTADGRLFHGRLAMAADGVQSWLRQAADIQLTARNYEQEAIVATVSTALPHGEIARQAFLETGPLAFLPLADAHTASIVWSLPNEEAKRLMTLDQATFCEELANAFSKRLGAVLSAESCHAFPLRKQSAKQYLKSRVVLVGDAAHSVHPLAGQGLNMGLLDAAALVEVITDAIQHGRDFATHATLRRYERWRKADNLSLLTGIDWIKNIFATNNSTMNSLRSQGLAMTNKLQLIKNMFAQYAVGNRNDLPKLAQSGAKI